MLPLCHQPIANALFIGKKGWWQMGGRWQQNTKNSIFVGRNYENYVFLVEKIVYSDLENDIS